MFPHQASGFYCASVSKCVLGGLVISSMALAIPLAHLRSWFQLTADTILRRDVVKYIASRSVFLDPKDIVCGGVILYHFRIFERRYGSQKFASYLLAATIMSWTIEVAVVHLLQLSPVHLSMLPTGPYGMVYALFIPFFCDIPRVAMAHLWGIPVTGKSFTYIMALQMASSSLESTLLAGIGLVSGILCRANFLWVKRWLCIPKLLARACGATLGRLVHTQTPTSTASQQGATLEIQRQQQLEALEQQLMSAQINQPQQPRFGFGLFGNRQRNATNGNIVPSEEQVRRLVEMGFGRDYVLAALRATNNDITMATNMLLHQT